jgi:hypothetical protein
VFNLFEVLVRPIKSFEENRFQELMQEHHYLGALPKISETIWYIATFNDQWIGWDFRHQYDRLKLVTNNSRF